MPAANQEKNAGGQFSGLSPAGATKGIQPQNQLATAESGDRRHPSADRQPGRQQRKDRQCQIEADLDRQAPHLGQSGGQRQRHVHLGERQIRQPHRQVRVIAVRQQGQDHHDGDQIGRHDADHPRSQVVTGGRARSPGRAPPRHVRATTENPTTRRTPRPPDRSGRTADRRPRWSARSRMRRG